jgi:hypothetical protein
MNKIKFSFMGVQPINLSTQLYMDLLIKKISFTQLDDIEEGESSFDWMKKYNSIYDVYEDLYAWDIPQTTLELKKDLFRDGPSLNTRKDTLHLSEYLNFSKATLYFDPRFVYFVLVYQIDFEIAYDILCKFLDYNPNQNNIEYKDLYNTVRNTIVKEQSNSKISVWGEAIQNNVQFKIKDILESLYKIKIDSGTINIPVNSCNISNFIMLPQMSKEEELVKKLISLNIFAERLTSEIKIEPLYNNTVYFSFNGRFHTIILKNKQDIYRFQPLQFHIQYMWFLVERYNTIMNEINKYLMQTDSLKKLQKYSHLIHVMINKIELLSLHDMNFKHSIEVDIEIYERNEKRWSISKLLQSSMQYVSFFKDYLDRLFSQKNALYQKKMNLILLGISFLQLLALVSVWNDYLSTLNKNNLNVDSKLLSLFGNSIDNLLTFNLFVPLGFIAVMIGFTLYLWKNRIK